MRPIVSTLTRTARRVGRAAVLLGLFVSSAGFAQEKLTLHQAVSRALASSPAARASAELVNTQVAGVEQAKLHPNPLLILQSEDIQPWAKNFSYANNTEEYGYVGQVFETAGKRGKRIAFAKAGLARAGSENTLRLRTLTSQIATAYWAAAAAAAARDLWQQQLNDFDNIVRYHRERVGAGATAGVDLIRIQVERDRVALQYEDALRIAELRSIDLAREIGLVSATGVATAESLETVYTLPPQPVDTLIAGRADVLAAEQGQSAAMADEKLQRAIAVPDPDLLGGYKRNVGSDTLFTQLQVPLPFFNRNQGEIDRAKSNERYAGEMVEQTRLVARAQILGAVAQYNRLGNSVMHLLPEMRQQAKENAAIISDAYASGGMDLLRYLDAKRTVIDTELLALGTLEQYQDAVSQLRIIYGEQL